MTVGALYPPVRALERKRSPRVVIESRRFPLRGVVTLDARSDAIRFDKLPPMDIGMAIFALCRGCGEVRVHQFGFKIRRLVAINACHRAVRTDQRKRSLSMIEL